MFPGLLRAGWIAGSGAGPGGCPRPVVDLAELVLGGGAVFVVTGGGQFQGLLVAVQGGVEVLEQDQFGLAGGEPQERDRCRGSSLCNLSGRVRTRTSGVMIGVV